MADLASRALPVRTADLPLIGARPTPGYPPGVGESDPSAATLEHLVNRMNPTTAGQHILCAGLTTFDVVQLYRQRPDWGAKGTAEETFADVGGPAANAAITIALLGGNASLATAIGTGIVADLVRSRLERLGVGVVDVAGQDTEVPVSSIWIDRNTGSRTVISTNRASAVAGASRAVVSETAAVLIDGHHTAICEEVVQRAVEAGVPVVLDGGSWKPVLERLLPHVSVAILSSDFRLPGTEGVGLAQARAVRNAYGVPDVAITRGPEPLLSVTGDGEQEIPVPRVEPVDTLGAGDVFHGAYVYFRYLERRTHGDALERAAQVASDSCTRIGTRAGVRKPRGT